MDSQTWLVTLSYQNANEQPVSPERTAISSSLTPAKKYKKVSLKINKDGEAVPVSIEAVKWNI